MISNAPPAMASGNPMPQAPLGGQMQHSALAEALIGKPMPPMQGADYSGAMPNVYALKALHDQFNKPDAAGGPIDPAYGPDSPAAGIAPSPMGLGARLGFNPGSAPYTTPPPGAAPIFGGAS